MDLRDLVQNNLKFYDSIKPKNPPDTYTVLATINDYHTGKLLCLATGTQANLKSYDDDIQDCHAESLVKRAYKRYVIDAVKHLLADPVVTDNCRELISSRVPKNVTLFVSKFPCGFMTRYEGQAPVDPTTGQVIRRKPGRGTERAGKTIYVEKDSCFVKLQKWLKGGIQGARLKQLFGLETNLKMIIIGNCETSDDFDYNLHLGMFRDSVTADQSKVEIRHADCSRRDEFIFRSAIKAQPVSVVWWHMEHSIAPNPNNNHELIVDGHKRGLTKQHCSNNRAETSSKLKIANAHLRIDLEYISTIYMKRLEQSGQPA